MPRASDAFISKVMDLKRCLYMVLARAMIVDVLPVEQINFGRFKVGYISG